MKKYITANIKLNKKANYKEESNFILFFLNREYNVFIYNIKTLQIDINNEVEIELTKEAFGHLDLVPYQNFKIMYKSIEIGEGKVLNVCGYNFIDFPLFVDYLIDHQNGLRDKSMIKLDMFIDIIKKDYIYFKSFITELSIVLEYLDYHSGENGITCPSSWFNSKIMNLLYDYYIPLIKVDNPSFNDLKYYCLFVRDKDWRKNLKIVKMCENLLSISNYKDEALMNFYTDIWSWRFSYAVHELPMGYLGENPYHDLEKIHYIRKIANTDDLFLCFEEEIQNYINSLNPEEFIFSDENWLGCGPFYDLSFLITIKGSKTELITDFFQKIKSLSVDVKFVEDDVIIQKKINLFIKKYKRIDFNAEIDLSDLRKARLNISQLSNELALIDICFHGSTFEEHPINKENKYLFRNLLDELVKKFNSELASINYVYNIMYLISSEIFNPKEEFPLDKINLDEVVVRLNKEKFEYAIIGKAITKKDIQKIFLSDDDDGW